jgi:hypothetical protein
LYIEIERSEDIVPEIIALLVGQGARINFAQPQEPDLEDIFLALTQENI